jgi:hypothetical protein
MRAGKPTLLQGRQQRYQGPDLQDSLQCGRFRRPACGPILRRRSARKHLLRVDTKAQGARHHVGVPVRRTQRTMRAGKPALLQTQTRHDQRSGCQDSVQYFLSRLLLSRRWRQVKVSYRICGGIIPRMACILQQGMYITLLQWQQGRQCSADPAADQDAVSLLPGLMVSLNESSAPAPTSVAGGIASQ